MVWFFPFGLFVLVPVVIYVIRKSAAAKMYIGPRYLICGGSIFYYHNVSKIILDYEKGTLLLSSVSGRTLLIQQKNFPTNARKARKSPKIRPPSFYKAAEKIVAKVTAAAPGVEVASGTQGAVMLVAEQVDFSRSIHLLYVPTLCCNLNCRYCYLGEQTTKLL